MQLLQLPALNISLAAAHARLARGDFDRVLPPCRRREIMDALRRAPAVYEAVLGVTASDLIPCNVDELDALTLNSRSKCVPPRGSGFRSLSDFTGWYAALNEFFHLLSAPEAAPVAKLAPLWWERPTNSTISRAACLAA